MPARAVPSAGTFTAPTPRSRVAVPVVVIVITALFVLTQLYLAIPLIEPVNTAFASNNASFALVTAFSLAYAAGFLIFGPLSDHRGRRAILLPGLFALSAATLLTSLAPSLPILAVGRAFQGLAAATFAPVALAWLSEAIPSSRRPVAIGAISTAFLVAGIFGQVLAAWVAFRIDWNAIFILTGSVLGVMTLVAALTLQEPDRDQTGITLARRFAQLATLVRRRSIGFLCLAHITTLLAFVAMYTALGPWLESQGMDSSRVILIRLIALPGMFASLAAGPVASRLGLSRTALIGYGVAIAGLILQAALSFSVLAVALASIVFVTGIALTIPTMITLFGALSAPSRAAGMALNGFVLFVGASAGATVGALPLPFAAILLLLAGLFAVASSCVHIATRSLTTGDIS